MLYHFAELTADEIKLIGHALGKLPYEVCRPLLEKLQAQINQHEAAAKQTAQTEAATAQ